MPFIITDAVTSVSHEFPAWSGALVSGSRNIAVLEPDNENTAIIKGGHLPPPPAQITAFVDVSPSEAADRIAKLRGLEGRLVEIFDGIRSWSGCAVLSVSARRMMLVDGRQRITATITIQAPSEPLS